MKKKKPTIALVHDYLFEYGGAERVLEALHVMYPEAPVYVAFFDKASLGVHAHRFKDWDIHTTWMQKIPGIFKLFSPLRFLAPTAFGQLDLSKFDVVISSSNAYYAKAVRAPIGQHLCYCHTPPRSLYGYATTSTWKENKLLRLFGEVLNHYLRLVDFRMAQKVDVFIANSSETKKRIAKFYRREASIIYPPVQVPQKLSPKKTTSKEPYYLYVNRLAFAKHPEIAVQACKKMNVALKVVGAGPILEELKAMAGPKTEFLGAILDDQLRELYAGAEALLYPVEDEDFGIVPVEAMGFGVPVLAHNSGGPRETIIEEKTGLFFDELSVAGLVEVMHLAQTYTWDREEIHTHAVQFGQEKFRENIIALVASSSAG